MPPNIISDDAFEASHDALVIGGGLGGLSTALCLAEGGIKVGVISAGPLPTLPLDDPAVLKADTKRLYGQARTTALLQGSLAVLHKLGLWPELKPYAAPLEQLCLVDDTALGQKPTRAVFDARLYHGTQDDQAFGWNFPNVVLLAALTQALAAHPGATLYTNLTAMRYGSHRHYAHVCLSDQRRLKAALLIGADGARSPLRAWAGIETQEHTHDQCALTFVISHSVHHQNISTEFQRPTGPFTFVPLPGGYQSSVVWGQSVYQGQRLQQMALPDIQHALQQASRGHLGDIQMIAGPGLFPVQSVRAKRLIGQRVALVAEAAHAMPPIGAQGLNSSLLDSAWLAHTLIEAQQHGSDIGENHVLKRYEQARFSDIQRRFQAVEGLNWLVTSRHPLLGRLRRLGLQLSHRSDSVQRLLMDQGMIAPKLLPGRYRISTPSSTSY